MIDVNPPLCELRDLGSTNGTFVNNQRVDRVRLASGDMIAAGQSVFRVQVDRSAISSSERAVGVRCEENSTQTAIRCTGCGTQAPRI